MASLREWYDDKDVLAPLIYPDLEKNPLLFIGMNPSFSVWNILRLIRTGQDFTVAHTPNFNVWDYFSHRNVVKNFDEWIKYEEKAKEHYNYYKPFKCVEKYVKKHCNQEIQREHIDLFPIRETKQAKLVDKLCIDKKIIGFGEQLLDITKDIISKLNPTIIVVANAKASGIFKKQLDLTWDDETGCYFTKVKRTKIQTHLTGMLSGQRRIDNESLNSLIWMISNSYHIVNVRARDY